VNIKETIMAEETTLSRFRVDGMDCAGCASKIDTAVRRMPGVSDVSVSVTAGTIMPRTRTLQVPKTGRHRKSKACTVMTTALPPVHGGTAPKVD
jgi:copper chaperone CopZ